MQPQPSLESQYQNSAEKTIVGNNGEYRVRKNKFLGRGGFGVVFAAIRRHTDSKNKTTYDEVVVKQYKKSQKWGNEQDWDKQLVVFKHFKDNFNYDYILKIYDIFQERQSKRYYLVLEYAQGGSLFDRIKDSLKEDEVYGFTKRSADILYYLHYQALKTYRPKNNERGQSKEENLVLSFIHRDFKPANLVYKNQSRQESMYLIDFGIAKVGYNEYPKPFNNSGTNNYKAPEIYQTRSYNAKVDIYSFGCTLYEVLTGGEKLLGTNGMSKKYDDRKAFVKEKLIGLQFRFIREKDKKIDCPNFWLQILTKCLAHEPKERWNSRELKRFLEQTDRRTFMKEQKYYFEEPLSQRLQLHEKKELYQVNFEIFRLNLIQERIFAIFEHLYFQQPRISKFTLYGILKYVIIFELQKYKKIKQRCRGKFEEKLSHVRRIFEDKKLEDIKKKALLKMNDELMKEKEKELGGPRQLGHVEEMIERYPELLQDTAAEPRRTLYEFCYQQRNFIMEDEEFSKMVAEIVIFMDELDWYPELQAELGDFQKNDPEVLSLKKLSRLKPNIRERMDKEGVKSVFEGCHIEQTLKEGINKEELKSDIPIVQQ